MAPREPAHSTLNIPLVEIGCVPVKDLKDLLSDGVAVTIKQHLVPHLTRLSNDVQASSSTKKVDNVTHHHRYHIRVVFCTYVRMIRVWTLYTYAHVQKTNYVRTLRVQTLLKAACLEKKLLRSFASTRARHLRRATQQFLSRSK